MNPENPSPINIPRNNLATWQEIVDIMAEIINIPAGLIMRLNDPDIEVYVSSESAGNPYHPGDREKVWGSGLYCETVIKTADRLLVPNALADADWNQNPDIKLNMISYLGFPILLPDGRPFGTICVLDNKENAYSPNYEKLITKFRDLVQSDLAIHYMNQTLGDQNRRVIDYTTELQTLRDIVPICQNCKSIRSERGEWRPIEEYLDQRLNDDFSHGICPDCAKRYYPDLEIYDD